MEEKLRAIEQRLEAIDREMADPGIIGDYQKLQALAKERAGLEPVVTLWRALRRAEGEIEEARSLLHEGSEPDMVKLARDELERLEPEKERPEAEEVEVDIDEEKEVRFDIYHSGGAGGQNVNKVATAVRVTHIPTGIVVQCQDERSQLKNKVKALMILRSRLLALKEEQQAAEISSSRKQQVGSGERAEKIRTYNFPQDRVTDHRVDLTRHDLPGFLDGDIDDLVDAVVTAEQAKRLEEQLVVSG